MNKADQRYTNGAIILHWLIAVLIIAMIGLGLYMVDIPKGTPNRAVYFNLHKSIGLVIALLVVVRLLWRARHTPPLLPDVMSKFMLVLAKLSHALLYTCMIVMPVSGFAASQFNKYGVTVFGLFKIPPMATESKEIYELLQVVHEVTAKIFIVLIAIHLLAALKHLLVDKDGVFQRMLPGKS
jgi:cytochrome b561